MPGPHLFNFVWWVAANHLWRSTTVAFRELRHDLVFSPGMNCLDADAISVHIVFAEYLKRVGAEINLLQNSIGSWPRLAHRRLYYRLLISLERRLYTDPKTVLILIARKTAATLNQFYGRHDQFPVLYVGLDHAIFNPARRQALRDMARRNSGSQKSSSRCSWSAMIGGTRAFQSCSMRWRKCAISPSASSLRAEKNRLLAARSSPSAGWMVA